MALTIRLSGEEKAALEEIQSRLEVATSSGAIKRVLLDWKNREERIMDLEKMLCGCKQDLQDSQSCLKRIKDAWSLLQSIAEEGPTRPNE